MEVFKPDCSGLPQTCPQPPESEARELKCTCPTVKCEWKQWSAWSATCGLASRTRTIETIKVSSFTFTDLFCFLYPYFCYSYLLSSTPIAKQSPLCRSFTCCCPHTIQIVSLSGLSTKIQSCFGFM